MNELLIITGPTAVGKTEISIDLAEKLNGEIISADSMQIYKGMDIGSAKITKDEMRGVPHHLIDIVEPTDEYSVAQYKIDAERVIGDIYKRGKLPIITGGTGLYINSLICNYSFGETYKDENFRMNMELIAKEKGNEYVHSMLKDIDSISYKKLHPNNLKRVIRALEVYNLSGKPISEYHDSNNIFSSKYKLHYFVLTMDRETLYKRINKRVDTMIENGLLNEVKSLYGEGCHEDMQSMKGIGYKEILLHLKGKISLDEAIDMIKQGSRNYAKRQLTWFRKDPRVKWVNKDEFNNKDEIINQIFKTINKGTI